MELCRDMHDVATVMEALYIFMDGLQLCLLYLLIGIQLKI